MAGGGERCLISGLTNDTVAIGGAPDSERGRS
jgi:hypothetical protein